MNFFRTALLLAVMTALFMGVGFMLAGTQGMIMALGFAVLMNGFAWWTSDTLPLKMHRARQVGEHDAPKLYRMVDKLSANAGMPTPKVYIMDSPQPNAFATGRSPNHAAVAVTTGIMNALNDQELSGVIAHELAHIKNRDTLIMTITATFAGAIAMLGNFALFFGNNRNNPLGIVGVILAMIVAPFAAMLVQMAVSRTREYAADRLGGEICENPLWLAGALEKIEMYAKNPRYQMETAEQSPATAHMFIINPLQGGKGHEIDNLFSTHPNTKNRIEALRKQARAVRTVSTGESLLP